MVAGAGMAGLSAAYTLEKDGADVFVVEARDRVGGRVWTIRDGFEHGQHAEAGADLIEAEQTEVLELAKRAWAEDLDGFFVADSATTGRTPTAGRRCSRRRRRSNDSASCSSPLVEEYKLNEERWDGAIAERLGTHVRRGVARSARIAKDEWLKQRVRALRGLFLADPERLSLLMLVEFFATTRRRPTG